MRLALAAIGLSVLGAITALAQEPTDAPNEIVVHGQRDPAQVRQFVNTVSAQMPVGQLARWNQDICPGVVGANWQQAQIIIDQVARRAMGLGLHVGQTGCAANLTIIVSGDAQNVVQTIYQHRRVTLINPNNVDGATLGDAALQDFVNTPRAVRWWHIAAKTTDDGHVLTDRRAASINNTSAAAVGGTTDASAQDPSSHGVGEGMSGMQGVRSNGSRLARATRHDFNSVLIVVDTTRLNGAPLSAVADYIAFVSLAQINPTAGALNFPTILNLFTTQDVSLRPAQMTDWDLDYLDGLYHATRAARNIGQQESEITRRMATPHS
jgi:hypothetical protein